VHRPLRLLLLVVAAGCPAVAPAQRDTTAIVRGVVTDSASRPIEDVEVYAPGIGRGVRTGSDGQFALIHLRPGAMRLLVRRLGWHMLDTTVTLEPGREVELRVSLVRIAQELEQVLIVARNECPNRTLEGFECRRRSGIGVFRDTTEFVAIKPLWMADLLYGVDGLRRVPTKKGVVLESTTGWRCLTILIDGVRPYDSQQLSILPLTDFIAVEFYDQEDKVPDWYKLMAFEGGSGGSLRGQSRALGRPCALIVYWSKFAPKSDSSLDPSKEVTRAREARRLAQARLLDSLRARGDSLAAKKPDSTATRKPN
jgi:hypothetical protein